MKRGQLAPVLIIVLLVAAVGGFYIFSEKSAGRAPSTLTATQPTQDIGMTKAPRSLQYNPPCADACALKFTQCVSRSAASNIPKCTADNAVCMNGCLMPPMPR